jgi:hypothetical protein
MTRTEERLTAALESAAAAVRVEEMPPLVAPEPGRAVPLRRRASRHAYRHRAWLAPLAAAASIAGLATAGVVLSTPAPSPGPGPAASAIGGPGPAGPEYYVDGSGTGRDARTLKVVSLATGTVTATAHAPLGTADLTFLAEQAQTGKWIAGFISPQSRELLYRFSITDTGKVTPLTRINGITLTPQAEDVTVLAVSPDGSRLALSEIPPGEHTTAYSKIVVLNLKTGAQQAWPDTLTDGSYQPSIVQAAWTPDGRALVLAARMCKLSAATGAGPCFWQWRSLRTPSAGGGFQAGPVLLRQDGMDGVTQAPAISPGGSSVVEARNTSRQNGISTLIRIDLATGKQAVLRRLTPPGPYAMAQSEGNVLTVAQITDHGNNGVLRGWLDGGFRFHPVTYPRTPR